MLTTPVWGCSPRASGYAERAVIIIVQFTRTSDPKIGRLLLDRGMRDIQLATELNPDDPRVLTRRARIFRLLAHLREMVEAAARLFDLWVYRHHATAWSHKVARNQREEFLQALMELTRSGYDDAETWSTIASAHLANDRLDEADRAVERALEHAAYNPRALAVRGTVALRRKPPRPHQAIADFDVALARSPRNYLAATGRAQAYESLNNLEEALSGFDHALRRSSRRAAARGPTEPSPDPTPSGTDRRSRAGGAHRPRLRPHAYGHRRSVPPEGPGHTSFG